MADFGVIKKVHSLLTKSEHLKAFKINDHIHISLPTEQNYPMVLVELEEIWSSPIEKTSPIAKIRFKTSTLSKKNNPMESLEIAENIRKEVDGKVITLDGGKTAICRLESSVVDTPIANKPRRIYQYYEGIIRG